MKVLMFVDLHGSKSGLKKIIEKAKNADLLVCAGDFTIFGEGQKEILSKFNRIGKPILIIHGNHEYANEVRRDCKDLKNCYFIHKKGYRVEDVVFLGWGGGGFSFRDKEFEKFSPKFKELIKPKDKVVLISHAPPYKTKIDDIWGEHAGNKSLRKFIEKVKPVLSISGHLHECTGEDKIKNTRVMNPGYKGKIVKIE